MKPTIQSILEKFYAIQGELRHIEKMEAEAHHDLLQHATNPHTPQAQRAVQEAASTFSLCKGARSKIEAVNEKQFCEVLSDAIDAWGTAVAQKQSETEEKIIRGNLIGWDGDGQACRIWWDQGNIIRMPALHKYRLAFFHPPSLRHIGMGQLIGVAEVFLRHIAKHSKAIGVNPESVLS